MYIFSSGGWGWKGWMLHFLVCWEVNGFLGGGMEGEAEFSWFNETKVSLIIRIKVFKFVRFRYFVLKILS